jgi:hypothetical protein
MQDLWELYYTKIFLRSVRYKSKNGSDKIGQ